MTDKTLFITGASSGIGAETARAAVARGWRVALMARSADKLDALVQELGADHALAITGDVTNYDDLTAATTATKDKFGQINAVFANAGMGLDTPGVADGDPGEWRRMMELNVMGVLWTVKATYEALKETKGHLVLTGSVAGQIHLPASVYGASKWFVHGFGGNMSEDMRSWGGRCTVIAPGMVDTPFFDEAKPDKLKPEDVAQTVIFALDQPKRADVRNLTIMPTG
ncbi:SDR family oxidoreductase [Roseovarius sp. MMSF_3281]|uniref:SDR family oxidoreductase n=1 Tax=Roseovarius sp. MMSF_3281 TaxID=3046694 RepID=UPI00273ED6B5|nr:SDR family oxidoreductase [Roseovarius sp. MMSF_3281]